MNEELHAQVGNCNAERLLVSPSAFRLHPSSFILHPSAFVLKAVQRKYNAVIPSFPRRRCRAHRGRGFLNERKRHRDGFCERVDESRFWHSLFEQDDAE